MKNKIKKYLPILLSVLMIFTSMPILDNSMGVYALDDKVLVYNSTYITDSSKQRAVTQAEINDAYDEILAQGIESPNKYGLSVNPIIYVMYGLIAYDEPSFSDMKYNPFTGRAEFRTLGVKEDGVTEITNDYYPDDASSNIGLTLKNWQEIDSNLRTWGKYNDDTVMTNYIINTYGVLNDGVLNFLFIK